MNSQDIAVIIFISFGMLVAIGLVYQHINYTYPKKSRVVKCNPNNEYDTLCLKVFNPCISPKIKKEELNIGKDNFDSILPNMV